jgi:signal-transduction protein with cAMP-binding, CBS, and nucleotidyltransferase domain
MDRCRTVGELRPKPALLLSPELSVVDAAVKMLGANADSGLVVSAEGALVGILTDKDVTNRVIANRADPTSMLVSEVMTANPMTVKASDNAIDALCLMIERRFRHLPVLDEHGAVVGMLDIAKCLYDAISRLERHLSSASSALSTAVLAALPAGAAGGRRVGAAARERRREGEAVED